MLMFDSCVEDNFTSSKYKTMKTKKSILIVYCCAAILTITFSSLSAQNVLVTDDSNYVAKSSAILDVKATDKGLLLPRVSLTSTSSTLPIISPDTSLIIYNKATAGDVTPGYYFWDGIKWIRFNDAPGSTGPQGPSGADGVNGIDGVSGATGQQGPTGANGTSVVLKGSAATVADLPTGALAGDLYVVLEDGNGYVSDGADNWANVGEIQGPAGANGIDGAAGTNGVDGAIGPQGPAGIDGVNGIEGAIGATGIQGSAGADGSNGTDGAVGATGTQGPAGADGTNGIDGVAGMTGQQGPTGADGTSVVLKGSAATVVDLPSGAMAGDLYVVLDDGNGYVSDGAENWANVGTIQGPAGIDGTNGIDGATGSQGPSGADGVNGIDGAAGIDGTNGIDGATGLQGPSGADGVNGIDGAAGIDGINGADGATGPQGTTGADGIDGSIGATGSQGPTGADGLQTAPYASYIDTSDQVTTNPALTYPITFNVSDAQFGFTHTEGTPQITAQYTGKYLITFSAIFQSSAPYKTFNIWLRVDGNDYAMSNTLFVMLGTNQNRIVTVTYIIPLAAGQNFELVMQSDDTGGKIDYTPHQHSPERPLCPSIILTVNKVSQ
jgi:hypothetical protein